MRKNTARHWLHACLDLLPVLLIPVFMIYSHRHDMTQKTEVDIQYKYQSNEVNTSNDIINGNLYHFNITNDTFLAYLDTNDSDIDFRFINVDEYNLNNYSQQLNLDDTILASSNGTLAFEIYLSPDYDGYLSIYLTDEGDPIFSYYIEDFVASDFTLVGDCIIYNGGVIFDDISFLSKCENIPIESVEVNDETSSVMNVFMDNFNNAVDKYFNMGNVFNMTDVYNWFNINIFGGNAPVVIYSVWNIVLYEFVMDLLFLLYGLFMWFIDMCKRLMEKPLDSIK